MPENAASVSTRKGARRRADVTPEILARLNAGELEAASLAESLSIDYAVLLARVAPELPASALAQMRTAVEEKMGVVQRSRLAGTLLQAHFGRKGLARFSAHRSDTVRGWSCYLVEALPGLKLEERLRLIRPLADDPNAGVREWAWMALRGAVAVELPAALALLEPWTREASPRLRRYATELTRPRGVWCAHLPSLKENPTPGLPLLEALRADPEKYVQDSVSNWLNDAAKSRPEWVRELCARWRRESPGKPTERICRRALRTVGEE